MEKFVFSKNSTSKCRVLRRNNEKPKDEKAAGRLIENPGFRPTKE